MQKKKIMIIVPPSTGHVNPICGLVHELCQRSGNNTEVIFYSDKRFQESIERTGATFRLFQHPSFSLLPEIKVDEIRDPIGIMLNTQISFSYKLIPQLLHDFTHERPDLVVYDGAFFPVKYTLEIMQRQSRRRRRPGPKPPKSVLFAPNFPLTKSVIQESRARTRTSLWSYLLILWAFVRQFVMSIRFRMLIFNPLKLFIQQDKLNIVSVIPELMPYPNEMDESFKCVGPCVCERVRSAELSKDTDDELKRLLGEFEVWAPGKRPLDSKIKLIYMSLGTVFNFNSYYFEAAIRAFREYNLNGQRREQDASGFRVIISTGGEATYKLMRDKIERGELNVPDNVVLRARVPQLDVLKRASLFISHCGMNSASEAIMYGVPLVAIPLEADQPLVAKTVCDRLMLGVRLDPLGLTTDEIADAVDKVLSDETYANNMGEMARVSAKYNGSVDGARILLEYLDQDDDDDRKHN